ncbi:MAG: cobalt ECF transporter T component CbiQ, partial [Myxococcales bacterium]
MGAGHGHALHFHGHSLLHRLPAWAKIAALVSFMLVVVATPRQAWWAYAAYAAILAVVIAVSRVPLRFLLPRMVIEVPFVIFAATMPLVAHGPRVEVWGMSLSQEGLIGGGALLAKGTLGVLAALVLGATTELRDFLVGLQRLRVPQQL